MKLLPYERFAFQTQFTPDQVREKLAVEMDNRDAILSWSPLFTNPAESGTAKEYKFETHPSFLRRYQSGIKGKARYERGITRIETTLMPSYHVILFAILTFGFFVFIWFLSVIKLIDAIGTPDLFFPLLFYVLGIGGVLLLGYLLFVAVVKFEASELENLLRTILDATEK